MKRCLSSLLLLLLLLLQPGLALAAEDTAAAAGHKNTLIASVSRALIASGDGSWSTAADALEQYEAALRALADSTDKGAQLKARLEEAKGAVQAASASPEQAAQAISLLAKETDRYTTAAPAAGEAGSAGAQRSAKALLPLLQQTAAAVDAADWSAAKTRFQSFTNGWAKAEGAIRNDNAAFYGKLEVQISGTRIALTAEPVDPAKAKDRLAQLTASVEDYAAGKLSGAGAAQAAEAADGSVSSISGLLKLIDEARRAVEASDASAGVALMDRFIAAWPSLEGEVSTRSQSDYAAVEGKMTAIPAHLESNPPKLAEAVKALEELRAMLEPYVQASPYTAWDAALILLREGVEAILVIGALLTFLKRSGHEAKRRWIWSGALAGIVISGVLAIVLSVVLSGIMTGSSRELMEGITGLVAVLFMLTIGAWLHKKSNLQEWNRFVKRSIGDSLARGTLWSLALTAFLAVMREGAETLIFYIGMAPSIAAQDLVLGIGGALVVLALLGFAILKLGSRLPVRPFFLVAGLMLYYLAFKFVGASMHALQVADRLPTHPVDWLPDLPTLGVYASWETALPQALVLGLILWSALRTELQVRGAARDAASAGARA